MMLIYLPSQVRPRQHFASTLICSVLSDGAAS
jgi:hypothetical protein